MNRNATLLGLALALGFSLRAQENLELGKMWTFENPPLEYWKEAHGFQASQEWLDKVRLSSLRMASGCSASFVSPKGLVMTNHHCVRDMVSQVSPRGKDWVKDGFVAKNMEDEVQLPGCVLQQLVAMKDVTAQINEGIKEGDSDADVSSKRDANQKKVVADAMAKDPAHFHQVTKLFQGAQFQLYSYKRWEDVRLVVAPNLQTSHFGGDPDNFVYPRYCIDFSFVRCYENGKPADSKSNYFKWCTTGIKDGDLVFVTGNPGQTNRLKTLAQLEVMRDVQYPIRLQELDNQIAIYHKFMAQDPQVEQQLRTQVLGLENSQKAFRGYLGGLQDPSLFAAKKKAEEAFQKKVMADPALKAKFGQVWAKLADIAAQQRIWAPRGKFYNPGNSAILTRAATIVRAVTAKEEKDRKQAKQMATRPLPARSEMGKELLTDTLVRARQALGAEDEFLGALLGKETPAKALDGILASKLYDDETVKKLIAGDEQGLKDLNDRVLNAALVMLPVAERAQVEIAKLTAEENAQSALLGQALFACYGTKVSPDATFTLRIQDGVVKGYPYNGTLAPWRTTFYGLYARATEFDGRHPFDLAKPWVERKDRIDLTKSLNFVSTNDIIGGNSGSPIVTKDAEVIGLIFDGNMEMLPNNFLYRSDVPRSVSVHVDAMIEALTKVYDAQWIADELIGTRG